MTAAEPPASVVSGPEGMTVLFHRRGQLRGPMIAVSGCTYASGERTEGSDQMFLATVQRSCAAIRDLGSLELG